MREANQKKLLDKYKGKPVKDARYALEVAMGYTACMDIYHDCRRLLKEMK